MLLAWDCIYARKFRDATKQYRLLAQAIINTKRCLADGPGHGLRSASARRRGILRSAFTMTNTVVVGIQWGDEGKGKFVDWLAEDFDVVVRFQGGNNAGHTLVVEGNTYKLSMLPSGAVRPGILSVIGGGAVLEPWAMLEEIGDLRSRGITVDPDNLAIADNIPLILNLHKELDAFRENAAGGARIGTTGRGIGPAYEDKIGRRAVRLADLGDEASTSSAVERLLRHHNALRNGLNAPPVDPANLVHELRSIAPKILPFARPIWKVIGEIAGAGPQNSIRGRSRRSSRHRSRQLSVRNLFIDGPRQCSQRIRVRHRNDRNRDRSRQILYDSRR